MSNIIIRNRCNIRCIHCPNPDLIENKIFEETTIDEIKDKIIERADSGSDLCFTGGGEPTMVRELPYLISYAKKLGINNIGLETNAVLLYYDDYVKKLKESGLDYCTVSLHSHVESICDEINQVPGSYKKIIKGMNNLIRNGIPILSVLHTISSLTYKDIKGFIMFVENEFDIKEISLSFIRPVKGQIRTERITPKISDIKEYLFEGLDYCKNNNIRAQIASGLGIPLCFLNDYEEHSNELYSYITCSENEFKKQGYSEDKIKATQCKECTHDICCNGIQESYANIYGTDEIIPIKTNLKKNINKCKRYWEYGK